MLQIGDIVFVRGTSLVSQIIRKIDGQYSHVTMMVTDYDSIEAVYHSKCKIMPFEHEDYDVLRLDLTEEQRAKILSVAKTLEGKRYDFLQILRILYEDLFHRKGEYKFNSPNRLICSEAVVIILQEIGAIPRGIVPKDTTPNRLYEYLKDYTK